MSGPLILGTNAVTGGYDVANSCRFDGSSSKLVKSQSAGNRDLWTYSVWIQWSAITTTTTTFFASSDGSNLYAYIGIQSYKIRFLDYNSGNQTNLITNRLFRDPSAWYHVVLTYDSAQATESNRVKLYINGVQETSFATETYPSQGLDSAVNVNSSNFILGSNQDQSSGSTWNGYMAESCFVEGQALDPTSFGEFDSDSPTIWKPIDVSGLTFGTNGFYLDFEDSANLGNDANGGTDFTESGLAATDQSTDTCTNNFATLNPLDVLDDDGRTLSEGNLNFTTSSGNNGNITATQAVSGSGKWYFETKISAQSGSASSSAKFGIVGVRDLDKSTPYSAGNAYYIYSDGRKEDGANTTNSATPGYTLNDIVQVALDLDGGNVYFGLNGNWGDNSGNFNQTFGNATAFFTSINTDGFWSPYFVKNVTADNVLTLSANFGSPSFTISSGNSDGNGHGNFEYAVPSGYFSLCTKNIAEHG